MQRRITAAGGVAFVVLVSASCGSPTAPVATVPVTSVRYEHVSDVTLEPETRLELEFSDCAWAGPPRFAGFHMCLLARDEGNVYRCPMPGFMTDAATTCDSTIAVRFRTASGNPFLTLAHDIYVNGHRVSRMTTSGSLDYPQEFGLFRMDPNGTIR